MDFPFPLLLCDVGGTNARFSLIRAPHGLLEHGLDLKTGQFPAFEDALAAALAATGAKPRSLILCAAGPVIGRAVKLTNAAWAIEGAKIAAQAGLDQGLLPMISKRRPLASLSSSLRGPCRSGSLPRPCRARGS